jgi:hypothetical protein
VNILYCSICTDDLYKYKQKEWRIACDECAEHHKDFHEGAFPGPCGDCCS